jgi:SAM-dependent methyltransferase
MRDREDAVGHLDWDFYHGKDGREVIERDDGYIDVSEGPGSYFADYHEWPGCERRAMRYVRGRILDVGCGAGRVALHLQRKGFDVTGIDNSPLAIKVCKLRGFKKALLMPFDRIAFPRSSFDTILLLGNNFGLFANRRRAKRLLERLHDMTSPHARIIAETLEPRRTDNPFHIAYHRRNVARGRMAGQVRIRVRHQGYATPWFEYLFVSKTEMRSLLQGTGWLVDRFLDSEGPMYIAILRKTG